MKGKIKKHINIALSSFDSNYLTIDNNTANKALYELNRHLEISKMDLSLLVDKGRILDLLGRFDEAKECYTFAYSLDSTKGALRLDIADYYSYTGNYKMAKERYQSIIDDLYTTNLWDRDTVSSIISGLEDRCEWDNFGDLILLVKQAKKDLIDNK